ncbi:MAG: hypothetical protein ACTSRA_11185 [Promethearchaeota archaeon]
MQKKRIIISFHRFSGERPRFTSIPVINHLHADKGCDTIIIKIKPIPRNVVCIIIIIAGMTITQAIIFWSDDASNSLLGTTNFTWPNLERANVDFTRPESEFDERIRAGFERYISTHINNYNSTLGMVISGTGAGSDAEIIARTRTQVRMALACLALANDNETYKIIANNILRTTYEQFQEKTPSAGYRTFGNFYWDLTDGKVLDLNAGPFNSIVLGYIFHYYKDLLDDDVIRMWEDGLSALIGTCVHRSDDPNYTNIHLLRTAGILILGKYFNDRATIELSIQLFREWKKYIASIGLTEYATINYYKVSLRAIMGIWEFAPTIEFSNDVEPMIDYLWISYLTQENNGNMGGPHSRDYENDYFYGGNIRSFIEHFLGDIYADVEDNELEWIPYLNWRPSPSILDVAINKTYPYTVQYSYGGIRATAYFTENYSIGAQDGVNPNGEVGSSTIPVYVTLNTSYG